MAAGFKIKEGVITIDTNTMDKSEKNDGLLQILVDLETMEVNLTMVSKEELA